MGANLNNQKEFSWIELLDLVENQINDGVVTEEWYYLVETNTVYLDFEPSEGALIEVGYVIYSD